MDLEEQKRALLPFMQRAQEMQTADPKMAYYCRMYAVEQAFKFEKRAPAINDLIDAALSQMEKEKPSLALDKENDRYHCEAVALKVFANADKVDRAGKATIGTAKAYLAASYFLDVLNHFEAVDSDILEKQKWAFWRAAEIRKALREGRTPLPPEPEPEVQTASSTFADADGLELPAAGQSTFGGAGQPPPPGPVPAMPPPAPSELLAGSSMYGRVADVDTPPLPVAPPMPPPPPPSEPHAGVPMYNGVADMGAPADVQSADADDFGLPAAPAIPAGGAPMPSGGSLMQPPRKPGPPRFRPGSQVLFMPDGGSEAESGTVGQVLPPGPDSWPCYKVALRDQLADAGELQLAPRLAEGDVVLVLSERIGGGSVGVPAHTVLMNDMTWPPTYLVRMPDGCEQAATVDNLSLALPEGMVTRIGGPAPPPAPLPTVAPPPTPPAPMVDSVGAYPQAPSSPTPPSAPPSHAQPPPPPPPPPVHAPTASPSPPVYTPTAAPTPSRAPTQPYAPMPAPVPPAGAQIPELGAMLPPGHKPSLQAVLEAQKKAKYAVSSLNFEDVTAAVQYLQAAIRLLTQP